MNLPRRSRRGSVVTDPALLVNHIGENETVSFDNFTDPDRKRFVKNRGSVDERMKFSVLSARIDTRWQLIEKLLIEVARRKASPGARRQSWLAPDRGYPDSRAGTEVPARFRQAAARGKLEYL
jgi:hypothetical protein